MADLGFELLFRFVWGSALILTLVSRQETTERFPRLGAWILGAIAGFAAWLAVHSRYPTTSSLPGLATLTTGLFFYAYGGARVLRMLGFALAFLAPIFFLKNFSWGQALNFASSGLLFGSIFVGQFLGHWFLTVPGLHIRELQRIVKCLIAALTVRTILIAYTLFVSVGLSAHSGIDPMGRPLGFSLATSANIAELSPAQSLVSISGDAWFGLGFYGLILLATRLLWGILAPWLLSYMVKQTVDVRSTQSATGILYALSVMVILGEGTALYLQNTLGWLQ